MMISFQKDSKRMLRFLFCILFILAISFASSSLLSCRVTVQGDPYPHEPGPTHLSRFEGVWSVTANYSTGNLEFHWTGREWVGRIWFPGVGAWEELANVFIDPRTGQVQFYRPLGGQQYSGTLSGNRIVGAFSSEGVGGFPWEAWRR